MKNGKYKLSLDNKTNIITYDNVILDNNLLFNKELDNEKLNQLIVDNNYYDIYTKLVKYISIAFTISLSSSHTNIFAINHHLPLTIQE